MKRTFLLLAIIAFMLTSCKKCRECFGPCSLFYVESYFLNEGFDATGDNFDNPYVKYITDSIRYEVITQYGTIEDLVPEINKSGRNKFRFNYDFENYTHGDKTGWYYFIIHLDKQEKDTVKIFYKNKETEYKLYQSDSLVGTYVCNEFGNALTFYK